MATKRNTSLALLLLLNLVFSSLEGARTPTKPECSNSCPIDALKLGICADLLGSLLHLTLGKPPVTPCCSLIEGLVDLEAAACLCTAIKANVLGIINLNVPLSLSLLLNVCSKKVPKDFVCA